MALEAAKQLASWGGKAESVPGLTSPEELEWQVRELKGDAYFFQGEWQQARDQYALLLARLLSKPADAIALGRKVEMLRKIGETWRSEGQYAEALKHFHRGLKLVAGNPLATRAQEATLHREIGYVLAQRQDAGDVKEELKHYSLAWNLVKDDPEEWALVSSLCTCLGTACERQVDPKPGEELDSKQAELLLDARRWHSRAIRLRSRPLSAASELARDRMGWAGALSNRAIVYEKLRRWDRCEADHRRSLRLFEEIGHELSLAIARLNFGEMYCERGCHPQAAEQYRGSLRTFITLGDRYGELIDHFNLFKVEETEALRRAHLVRALTLAAVDERWERLGSYAGKYLEAHPEGAERDSARDWLERVLTNPAFVYSYPDEMAMVLAPTAAADQRTLREKAKDKAWVAKVIEMLQDGGAK